MALPTDPQQRKEVPIASGFLDYFQDAIAEVAALSAAGNAQHNPGKPLHWDRDKSGDEADALMRHFMERGTFDTDGIRHSAKVAWRALALLQKELEAAYGLPLPRGARSSETKNARETYQEAVYESEIIYDTRGGFEPLQVAINTEVPEEDYGNSLATEPADCQCDDCCNSRLKDARYEKEIQANFPPYTFTYPGLARVAGVERGEVVGVLEKRAESQGKQVAPEVRSVERIKEAVFGTKQAPEV